MAAAEQLSQTLGLPVEIRREGSWRRARGEIRSEEELQRLFERLLGETGRDMMITRKPVDNPQVGGMLGEGVSVEGTLIFSQTFRVDGEFKGKIASRSDRLVVGEKGKVSGEIEVNALVVYGRVEGTIKSKGSVEVHPKGRIVGDLEMLAPALSIMEGGFVEGTVKLSAKAEPGPSGGPRRNWWPSCDRPPPQTPSCRGRRDLRHPQGALQGAFERRLRRATRHGPCILRRRKEPHALHARFRLLLPDGRGEPGRAPCSWPSPPARSRSAPPAGDRSGQGALDGEGPSAGHLTDDCQPDALRSKAMKATGQGNIGIFQQLEDVLVRPLREVEAAYLNFPEDTPPAKWDGRNTSRNV